MMRTCLYLKYLPKLRHFPRPFSVGHLRVQSAYPKNAFLEFYKSTTGKQLNENEFTKLKKKHGRLDELSEARLHSVREVLQELGVCEAAACSHPHVFTVHPLTAHNYGQVLRECGFHLLRPHYITGYHTLVRSRTIAQLKKAGLILTELAMEDKLVQCFSTWPSTHRFGHKMVEEDTTLLQVRLKVMSKYLSWRLGVANEEFEKLCRHYNALKHRPMADIQEAIDLGQYNINFTVDSIKRHGFIISADPTNTKQILENVKDLAGVDIRQVLRMVPAIIKSNHIAILRIRDILEEYRIDKDAQKRCFMVYCMHPGTVQQRLAELSQMKEFQVLSSNPRALQMVVHQRKMLGRLSRLRAANKQCYSLHNLLSSATKFNEYVSNFGDRTCSRDLAAVMCSALRAGSHAECDATPAAAARATPSGESVTRVAAPTVRPRAALAASRLKRHPYWRHVPPDLVHDNIQRLKCTFGDDVIFEHCQLLLYPMSEMQPYLEALVAARGGDGGGDARASLASIEPCLAQLRHAELSDAQVLSLVLYAVERKHHFTGDGIWSKGDAQTKSKMKSDCNS